MADGIAHSFSAPLCSMHSNKDKSSALWEETGEKLLHFSHTVEYMGFVIRKGNLKNMYLHDIGTKITIWGHIFREADGRKNVLVTFKLGIVCFFLKFMPGLSFFLFLIFVDFNLICPNTSIPIGKLSLTQMQVFCLLCIHLLYLYEKHWNLCCKRDWQLCHPSLDKHT
jgi:hypothetical protein